MPHLLSDGELALRNIIHGIPKSAQFSEQREHNSIFRLSPSIERLPKPLFVPPAVMAQTPEGDSQPAGSPPAPAEQDLLQTVLSLLNAPPPTEQQDVRTVLEDNTRLRTALSQLATSLRDKSALCITLERKVEALVVQVASLKEVASLTRDLLTIRNTEVEHLRQDMDSMEKKMEEQRASHNLVIAKLDKALQLNEQLKTEYETQLKLFQSLKGMYQQRADLMDTQIAQKNEKNALHDT